MTNGAVASGASASNANASANKRVWLFREGKKELKDLLGGKGANLAEMTNIGLPVPPGFTITTEVCTAYYDNDRQLPAGLMDDVKAAVADVEKRNRQEVRRRQKPAAVFRPLRRQILDAGHDGHRSQPRPERRNAVDGLMVEATSGDSRVSLTILTVAS